jgi:hypothetical protein
MSDLKFAFRVNTPRVTTSALKAMSTYIPTYVSASLKHAEINFLAKVVTKMLSKGIFNSFDRLTF